MFSLRLLSTKFNLPIRLTRSISFPSKPTTLSPTNQLFPSPMLFTSPNRLISPTTLGSPPPFLTQEDLRRSTSDLYADFKNLSLEELARPEMHDGPWGFARSRLDYTYHRNPSPERRALQDEIVSLVLAESHKEECRFCHPSSRSPTPSSNSSTGRESSGKDTSSCTNSSDCEEDSTLICKSPNKQADPLEPGCCNGTSTKLGRSTKPVALFTSGGMGAGKGHVLRTFLEDGRIRLEDDFVWIDPDKLSQLLPERPLYLLSNPDDASTLLHAEASLLQELLTTVARQQHRSVVIDGSLSCSDWFRGVMTEFRQSGYLVEVVFVFCRDEDVMWHRAEKRRIKTGRRVSRAQIHNSRLKSPVSVQTLSKPSSDGKAFIDRLRLVDNSTDLPVQPPVIVYDSTEDPGWKEGLGGDVPVEKIALGEKPKL
ncbi:zeta toxin family protein [Phaffia rhodozyma]|uniref:Zeta toxin family protein n=1 Tax=Phaffia rhodozyma TaxID=264483 RepID=A0A0F7SIX4_PHARH|nr:zeta toxin family protein [Phaffia rhodozyma]